MDYLKIKSILIAGIFYFTGIFLLGFILGTIRTVYIIPYSSELIGVLLEIPIMLTLAWFFSIKLIKRYALPTTEMSLFLFGETAFVLLMITEVLFSVYIFNLSLNTYLYNLKTLPGFIGLFGQIIFGLIPSIQSRTKSV